MKVGELRDGFYLTTIELEIPAGFMATPQRNWGPFYLAAGSRFQIMNSDRGQPMLVWLAPYKGNLWKDISPIKPDNEILKILDGNITPAPTAIGQLLPYKNAGLAKAVLALLIEQGRITFDDVTSAQRTLANFKPSPMQRELMDFRNRNWLDIYSDHGE